MFQKMSLKGKLLFLCTGLSMITAGVGVTGYLSLVKVTKQYRPGRVDESSSY